MALFGQDDKTSKEARPTPAAPPVPESKPPASAAKPIATTLKELAESEPRPEVMASIGRGSRLAGKLQFDGTVRIDGTIEGEISAQDAMHIGERAVVNAQVSGSIVIIRGQVTGDVRARKRVEIHAPGKLRGNIVTPNLVIEEGVVFEGHCSMGPAGRPEEGKVTPLVRETTQGTS